MTNSVESNRSSDSERPQRAARGGGRRGLLVITVVAFAAAAFVLSGWFRGSALPGAALAAVELNVALLQSEATHFLGRDVWEHTFGVREGAPAYSLYMDERGRTVGFAAMLEYDAEGGAVDPDALRPALAFLSRYVGDVGLRVFIPAPHRNRETSGSATSRETRRVVRGLNVWLLEYGEYQPLNVAANSRLLRSRAYVVVTNAGWPIPEGVNAR
ncbi:MAG: hypothetical protein IPM64_05825 [Phycisphaerales bacterium]|nr:hypothetical protein [Phycisphaerales bacterium]